MKKIILKIFAKIYFGLFCRILWKLQKNLKQELNEFCLACSGHLDDEIVSSIDLAGAVKFYVNNKFSNFFYDAKFLSFYPKLQSEFVKLRYFITNKDEYVHYKICTKCKSLNLQLPKQDVYSLFYSYSREEKIDEKYLSKNSHYFKFAKFLDENYLKKNKPFKILDVGCGSGEILLNMPENQYLSLVGIEPNDQNILNKKYNSTINIVKELYEPDIFQSNWFDLIFSYHSIEHFHDVKPFFEGAKKHLKSNGKMILSTPESNLSIKRADNQKDRFFSSQNSILFCIDHKIIFSKEYLLDLAKSYGFALEKILSNESNAISSWGEKPSSVTMIFKLDESHHQ